MKTQIHLFLNKVVSRMGYELVGKDARLDRNTLARTRAYIEGHYNGIRKVHYGCGRALMQGWLNVDYTSKDQFWQEFGSSYAYVCTNLASISPFPSNFFRLGFSQDFLEHLEQKDALTFVSECYRCFQADGVLRLSFPGLEGVLKHHYRGHDGESALTGKQEAFSNWGHRHFFCREELVTVAHHIGFRKVDFVEHGESQHPELRNLDTRNSQIGLNTYVELTK